MGGGSHDFDGEAGLPVPVCGGAHLSQSRGVAAQKGKQGIGDGGGVIGHQGTRDAVFDHLLQAAHARGEHGYAGRVSQQRRRAETLFVAEVDEQAGGGQVRGQVAGKVQFHAGQPGRLAREGRAFARIVRRRGDDAIAGGSGQGRGRIVHDVNDFGGDAGGAKPGFGELRDGEVGIGPGVLPAREQAGFHGEGDAARDDEGMQPLHHGPRVRVGVVRVVDVPLAPSGGSGHGKPFAGGELAQGGIRRSAEGLIDAETAEGAQEEQDLVLAAAHFASGIHVENAHGQRPARKRALAYFRKL